VKEKIIDLLNELKIPYRQEPIDTGGYKFYFELFGGKYCLFTSCWKDYGLHFYYPVYSRKNSRETFQKIIDYQKNLDRIKRILEPIVEFRNEKYPKKEDKENGK
jgi:hypothetical protein